MLESMAGVFLVFLNMKSSIKLKVCFVILICLSVNALFSQRPYLGQPVPNSKPVPFATNIISPGNSPVFGSVFNKSGTEFYYAAIVEGKEEIRIVTFENGKWSTPKTIIESENFGYNDPMLSPDETRLYYISNHSSDINEVDKDHDIWYSERTEKGWSPPINAGSSINSKNNEYYMSFNNAGDIYFSSNKNQNEETYSSYDIYVSRFKENQFLPAKKLDSTVNTKAYEADVFVAPDESYIIFCGQRKSGFGRGDLYISFKDKAGSWTQSVNMGPAINTEKHELCPFVSADGNYLFFTRNNTIYWVNTEILKQFRK